MLKWMPDAACFAKGEDIFIAIVLTVAIAAACGAVIFSIYDEVVNYGGGAKRVMKQFGKALFFIPLTLGLLAVIAWTCIYLCTQAYCLYEWFVR